MRVSTGNIIFILFVLLLVCGKSIALAGAKHEMEKKNSSSSVLSEGEWIKIGVTRNQVYKLDYSFFNRLGLSPASIDPATIKIYGNGCHMLPQENSAPRAKDLTENNIYVKKGDDTLKKRNSFTQTPLCLIFSQFILYRVIPKRR